jgi:hypothetical protein
MNPNTVQFEKIYTSHFGQYIWYNACENVDYETVNVIFLGHGCLGVSLPLVYEFGSQYNKCTSGPCQAFPLLSFLFTHTVTIVQRAVHRLGC